MTITPTTSLNHSQSLESTSGLAELDRTSSLHKSGCLSKVNSLKNAVKKSIRHAKSTAHANMSLRRAGSSLNLLKVQETSTTTVFAPFKVKESALESMSCSFGPAGAFYK